MEYLLSPKNISVLESFCHAHTLFAFDYDGTLAPICERPDEAFMSPSMARLVAELNDMTAVAVLTGRSIASVSELLPIKPAYLIGNHGAEGIQTSDELAAMKVQCRAWILELEKSQNILDKLGVVVEDKTFSLSLHYRRSQDPEVAKEVLSMLVGRFSDCRITTGKAVINVLPGISLDKGSALNRIMKSHSYRFGVFFGDDQTDEDVFQYHSSQLLTVKVGTEATSARYYVKGQSEMEDVLKLVASFIERFKAPV